MHWTSEEAYHWHCNTYIYIYKFPNVGEKFPNIGDIFFALYSMWGMSTLNCSPRFLLTDFGCRMWGRLCGVIVGVTVKLYCADSGDLQILIGINGLSIPIKKIPLVASWHFRKWI